VLGSIASCCPAIHVATVLHDCIMTNSSALPFCRPVNAAALKLHDYHDIITHPMDLGTVHSRCLLGEYDIMQDLLHDVELVFKNAMLYNPKGHVVHSMAEEMSQFSMNQFDLLASHWRKISTSIDDTTDKEGLSCKDYGKMSMRLGARITLKMSKKEKGKNDKAHEHNASFHDKIEMGSSIVQSASQSRSLFNPTAQIVPESMQRSSSKYKARVGKFNVSLSGPHDIAQSMVGNDVWLLNKRNNCSTVGKGKKKKQKKSSVEESISSLLGQRQTESWLGDEVLNAVRRLRTDFFVCHLCPKQHMSHAEKDKLLAFETYLSGFDAKSIILENKSCVNRQKSGLADTRCGLLELSQYRNFQFDTIRRAKYSTAMLLYYLKNPKAPGLIPTCTSCQKDIKQVRWHRVKKAFDERRRNSLSSSVRATCIAMDREDLCAECLPVTSQRQEYIPVRMSTYSF